MPRFRLLWLEIAEQQYRDLPTEFRGPLNRRLTQLVNNPTLDPNATYNERSDQ